MIKLNTEEKASLKEKLEYIGLDLENIPDFLKEYTPLDFRPSKSYDESIYKVYKYIPIDKIQILLTNTNRLNSIGEKYALASHIYQYLEPQKEEDIIKHTTFLKMLKNFSIEEVELIEKTQQGFNEKIPFKVKYSYDYLWQIYYSENTDQYFMLVPTEDLDHACFFYLLKKQIGFLKTGKQEKIFAPVSYMGYSREYFKKSEIQDIEKYIWLFTKEWPFIYEVYDKLDNLSVQIVGLTNVYEKIKSYYKIELNNKDEAVKFYKLIKALFILQTELPKSYTFETKIGEDGGLDLLHNSKIIAYENLSKYIRRGICQKPRRA